MRTIKHPHSPPCSWARREREFAWESILCGTSSFSFAPQCRPCCRYGRVAASNIRRQGPRVRHENGREWHSIDPVGCRSDRAPKHSAQTVHGIPNRTRATGRPLVAKLRIGQLGHGGWTADDRRVQRQSGCPGRERGSLAFDRKRFELDASTVCEGRYRVRRSEDVAEPDYGE